MGAHFDIGKDGGNYSLHHHWDFLPAMIKQLEDNNAAIVLQRIMFEWVYKNNFNEEGSEVPFECSIRTLAFKLGFSATRVATAITVAKEKGLLEVKADETKKSKFTPKVAEINKVLRDFVKSKEAPPLKKRKKEKKGSHPMFDRRDGKPGEVNFYPDNPLEEYLKKRWNF